MAKAKTHEFDGSKLKKIREATTTREPGCVTQKQLAQAIGVEPVTVTHYESGHRAPNAERRRRIAAFFNKRQDAFLKGGK